MECAIILMMKKKVSQKYWREVVSIVVYTLNRVQVKKGTNATPFELWYGYTSNVKYFKVFGRKFYILKDNKNGNFDAKSDEGIFLGYSTKRKAYKCLKCLRYDRGREVIFNKFNILCNDRGIKSQISTPRTPPQNVIV